MDIAASDNKSKYRALGLTILFHALLFLLFLLRINVPDPPFPVVPMPEAILDLTGMGMTGSGNTDAGGSGKNDHDLATKSEPAKVTPVVKTNTAEDVITDKTGEVVDLKTSPKKKPKKQVVTEVVKPTEEKVKEDKETSELANMLAVINSKRAHSSEGDGGKKTGGTGQGTGPGPGNGPGTGHGPGPSIGPGPGGPDLIGRSLERRPQRMTDSGEEGTVVVEIIVDETGKVIKATPGKRGSTTTSANLYAKARQAAMQAKFNPREGVKEQRGTYTFVFTLE